MFPKNHWYTLCSLLLIFLPLVSRLQSLTEVYTEAKPSVKPYKGAKEIEKKRKKKTLRILSIENLPFKLGQFIVAGKNRNIVPELISKGKETYYKSPPWRCQLPESTVIMWHIGLLIVEVWKQRTLRSKNWEFWRRESEPTVQCGIEKVFSRFEVSGRVD